MADVLRDHGITLLDSTAFLAPLLARDGVLTQTRPDARSRPISSSATAVADAIAGLDIGQTIAVEVGGRRRRRERMEGTDAVIARAAQLAGTGVRIIKVAKPNQDMRFDVPVVGVSTIEAMQAAGATTAVGGRRQDADDRRRGHRARPPTRPASAIVGRPSGPRSQENS